MADAEVTTDQLARALGCTRPNVSHYRHGTRTPDPETLAKICRRLHISADWLLGIKSR